MSDLPTDWTWCSACRFAHGEVSETCSRCGGPAEQIKTTSTLTLPPPPAAAPRAPDDRFTRWWVSHKGRPPLPEEAEEFAQARAIFDDIHGHRLPVKPPVDEIEKSYADGWMECAIYVLSRLPMRAEAQAIAKNLDADQKKRIWALLDMRRYLEDLAFDTRYEVPPHPVPPLPCVQCRSIGMSREYRSEDFIDDETLRPGATGTLVQCIHCSGAGFIADTTSAEWLANIGGPWPWEEDDVTKRHDYVQLKQEGQ